MAREAGSLSGPDAAGSARPQNKLATVGEFHPLLHF